MQPDIQPGQQGCPAVEGSTCLRQVLALGNPVIWWAGAAGLLAAAWAWVARRDWRYGVPVVGVAATWLPWFGYAERSIFLFYAVAIIPFTCMALALLLGRVLGPAARRERRRVGAFVVAVVLLASIAATAFFWPVWTDALITSEQWERRMWIDRWV